MRSNFPAASRSCSLSATAASTTDAVVYLEPVDSGTELVTSAAGAVAEALIGMMLSAVGGGSGVVSGIGTAAAMSWSEAANAPYEPSARARATAVPVSK